MKLLCTIASGEGINFDHITVPRMYSYARRHGADFYAVTRRTHGPVRDDTNDREGGPSMWKLALMNWFTTQSHYSQLAFVDADVLIKKNAPSIFDAFDDGPGFHVAKDMNNERELPLWADWAWTHYKFSNKSNPHPFYGNCGVWAVNQGTVRRMVETMYRLGEIHTRYEEQDFMNLLAHKCGAMKELPSSFNVPFPYLTTDHTEGHFLHLCGLANQDKLPWLEKLNELDV